MPGSESHSEFDQHPEVIEAVQEYYFHNRSVFGNQSHLPPERRRYLPGAIYVEHNGNKPTSVLLYIGRPERDMATKQLSGGRP